MIEPIIFDLPPEEAPEPGIPASIEHGCDYMIEPGGSVMFHYNFLTYQWIISGETISARAYLDTLQKVDVFVGNQRLRTEAALQPLVRYLQRRYMNIGTFHADDGLSDTGYVAAFRNRNARSVE